MYCNLQQPTVFTYIPLDIRKCLISMVTAHLCIVQRANCNKFADRQCFTASMAGKKKKSQCFLAKWILQQTSMCDVGQSYPYEKRHSISPNWIEEDDMLHICVNAFSRNCTTDKEWRRTLKINTAARLTQTTHCTSKTLKGKRMPR